MSDSRGDGRFPSLRRIFNALAILSLWHEGLPENFDDIPNVNVYEAPGEKGGDWKQYLNDKGQAWIITPLYYSSGTRSRYIRKASGGGRWNGHGPLPLKKNVDASWVKRKYILETKEGTGLPTYTMFEYSPAQDKPTHALCRITVDNENIESSQKQEGKEIDHTDSNNEDKRKTSQSQESMQQDNKNNAHDRQLSSSQQRKGKEFDNGNKGHKGGNFQNTTADYNPQILEVLDQIESKKLPTASPKEHSTEAPVSNTWDARSVDLKKHGDTSWKEHKYKLVENTQEDTNKQTGLQDYTMIEYTSDEAKPKHSLCRITIDNKKYTHDILLSATQQPTTMEIDHADANKGDKGETSLSLESMEQGHVLTTGYYNQVLEGKLRELIRQGFSEADILEAFCRIKSEKIPAATFEQWIEKDTLQGLVSSCSTHYRPLVETGGSMDWQVVEQNVQDPHNLSQNFSANSTELKESRYYLPSYNQNIIAPGPTPTYYAPTVLPITDQGTYNASEEQQFSLCNTQHGQMFEPDAYVLEPNNSSYNFKTISTEPTEMGNHLPIYNKNTIAPGLDTNNNATTEPEDMEWRSYLN